MNEIKVRRILRYYHEYRQPGFKDHMTRSRALWYALTYDRKYFKDNQD